MTMLKAVLFDLDGTLLDTVPDIQECVNRTLAAYGYPAISYAQACAYIGDGARKLVERAMPSDAPDVEQCYKAFRADFALCDNALTGLYPGEKETLCALKERGIKLGIVTNKPHEATLRLVEQYFPAGTFDFVAGDSGEFACKPDPSLARYAALTMRVSCAECAFVGDGETDALVARNAGMLGISVLWGYRTRAQLEQAGAKRFVNSYQELLSLLKKNF